MPPSAQEIEEVVLGAIMLERGAFDVASGYLKEECFYVDAHQKIFNACRNLSMKYMPIEMITVVEELKRNNELDVVGGPFYISKLTMNVTSSANIETHCLILLEKYMKREIIKNAGKMLHDAYEDSTDVFELLDESEQSIFNIANSTIKNTYKSAENLGVEALDRIEFLRNHPQDLTGIPTGYSSLDRLTCGWQPSDLIIIAARPSVGKTALALNFALHAAKNDYKQTPVGFFSLEMSSSQLMERIISMDTKIFLDKIKRGRVNDWEMQNLNKAVSDFENLPIYIDETPALNIYEFRSRARRMASKHKVGLIILDYLQLMRGTSENGGNREQEISTISRNLKALAKELNIPIIALSQMSRDIEKRKGAAQLSDLRESGAIEQDADFVAFLSREDYQQNKNEVDPLLRGLSYMDIKKHRNGDLDRLAFKTDLRIQTWFDDDKYKEYTSHNELDSGNWKKIEPENNFITEDDDMPF